MTLQNDALYHYTGSAAMRSIWESKSIWATHSFYLNDSKEFLHGYERWEHEFDWHPVLVDFKARYPAIQERLMQEVTPNENGQRRAVYVASFSEESDDLNQWRSYTSPGDGYAITVNKTLLSSIAAERGWRLERCLYGRPGDVAVQTLMVEGVQALEPIIRANDDDGLQSKIQDIALRMATLAPTLKHRAFAAENEWRLISPTISHVERLANETVKYRTGASFMAPYVDFPFGDQFDEVVWSAVVGPGPNQDLASEAFGMWLSRDGRSTSFSTSTVPYRPW